MATLDELDCLKIDMTQDDTDDMIQDEVLFMILIYQSSSREGRGGGGGVFID